MYHVSNPGTKKEERAQALNHLNEWVRVMEAKISTTGICDHWRELDDDCGMFEYCKALKCKTACSGSFNQCECASVFKVTS